MSKVIQIIAGPNGSGKTTFASALMQHQKAAIYLNPDLIASGISVKQFEAASVQAGRVLISEVKSLINRESNFCFESTLSGLTWAPILKDAVQRGYRIEIYFLYLNSIKMNIERIRKRVVSGGHNIPVESVLRRHPRVFNNFWNLYRPMCRKWTIVNNSNGAPKLVMSKGEYDKLEKTAQDKFAKQFLELGYEHGKKI